MKKSELIKVIRQVSGPLGYQYKGNNFWKSGKELTALVNLQKGAWGDCIYVNIGVLPTSVVRQIFPPHDGYFGIHERASGLKLTFQKHFERLESKNDDGMAATELVKPFAKLLEWMDRNYLDPKVVRRAIQKMTDPIVSDLGTVDGLMRDWAKGELKALSKYPYGQFLRKKSKPAADSATEDDVPGLCWSVHFKSTDLNAVTAAAKKVIPKASGSMLIAKPKRAWISVYPSREVTKPAIIKRLAAASGVQHTIAIMLYDDDLFCYWYYRDGKLADTFNSCPDCLGTPEKADLAARGGADAFDGLLSKPARARLAKLIATRMIDGEIVGKGPVFDFEHERLTKFSRLFGISRAADSFENLEGEHAVKRMVRIG